MGDFAQGEFAISGADAWSRVKDVDGIGMRTDREALLPFGFGRVGRNSIHIADIQSMI